MNASTEIDRLSEIITIFSGCLSEKKSRTKKDSSRIVFHRYPIRQATIASVTTWNFQKLYEVYVVNVETRRIAEEKAIRM